MAIIRKNYGEFINYLSNIDGNIGNGETKGQKKLIKILGKYKKLVDEYNEQIEDTRLEFASVDEKTKNLILDEKGGYTYTKEAKRSLTMALRTLTNKEIEFEVIDIKHPAELEYYYFLKDWITGVEFITPEDEEL